MQRRSLIRRGVVDVRVGLRGEARNYWYRYTIPLVSERWQDELLITNRRRCDVHCCEWWLLWWPFMLMCSLRACESGAAAGLLFIASSPSMSCCPTPGRSSRRMSLVDTPTIRPNPCPILFTCSLAACTALHCDILHQLQKTGGTYWAALPSSTPPSQWESAVVIV